MFESKSIVVMPGLEIPRTELEFRASRSGGPGGQHVNTSSTRIELLWDLMGSRAITDEQRERLRVRLAARLDADGRVRVVASDRRSQAQNKQSAETRLAELIARGLYVAKKRRPTKPTQASTERRLSSKKRQSDKKRNRRPDLD